MSVNFNQTLLILGSIWPEERASAASSRVISLVDAFLRAGYQITFSADGRENAATDALRARGVTCVRLAPNDSAFDTFVADLNPSVCIFDRFGTEEKFGWRVRQSSPQTVRVLDTIDLHFLRLARQRAAESGHNLLCDWHNILDLAADTAPREVASIYRSDLTLMVSDDEMHLLNKHCLVPNELMLLSRLTYPRVAPNPPFAERSGFVMIGNFRHPPNEDAVHWVRDEIWPLIRAKKSDAKLHVWGSHALPKHIALSQPDRGFYVKGYAPDQFDVLRFARVNLAPLRFGAGVKGKIADGWFTGTPVVTTTIGIEGMTDGMTPGGVIATTAADIADAAVALHDDEMRWMQASSDALALIEKLYSFEATMTPVVERVAYASENLKGVRTTNFIGQMLWQQGLRSTEYFSRWIEVKNKSQKP